MDDFGALALREREARRIGRRQWSWLHFVVFVTIEAFLFVVWTLDRKYHYPGSSSRSSSGAPWWPHTQLTPSSSATRRRGRRCSSLPVPGLPALSSTSSGSSSSRAA